MERLSSWGFGGRLPRHPQGRKPRSLDGPPWGSYHSISQLLRPPSGGRLAPFRGRAIPRGVIDAGTSAAVLDGLKARLEQLLRDGAKSDPRAYVAGLRDALLEGKVGVGTMRDALAATEHELAAERKLLEDAERR